MTKRRNILFGTASLLAASSLNKFTNSAWAAGAPDADRLKQDLTPLGGERAASASGLVPAWTGEGNKLLAGSPPDFVPPALFDDEKPIFTVTASNVDKYADMLSAGSIELLKRYGSAGFRIDVYPAHRTGCAPQAVYDGSYANVSRTQTMPDSGGRPGIINGFTGMTMGPPFPIPSDDPVLAGAQINWNNQIMRGQACTQYLNYINCDFVVGSNQRVLTSAYNLYIRSRIFDESISPQDQTGFYLYEYLEYVAPPNQIGGKFLVGFSTQPFVYPQETYEYLVGEGRIREAPSVSYDIPAPQTNDVSNYGEANIFAGNMDRYTWKLVGKKEMIVPYNSNKTFHAQPNDVMGLQFINPDLVRFEVHRCWVVEATLAPGARMTEPVRRLYYDEDTWISMLSDNYDHQGNLWKTEFIALEFLPQIPGFAQVGYYLYDLQANEYVASQPFHNAPAPLGGGISIAPLPNSKFDVQSMANSGGL